MATKKITELPLITRISGSQEYGGSVLPVVVGGTTNQISAENFSRFVNAYDAQTGSQNIFTQNQWFNAIVSASTINVGTLGVGGNTTIAGTLGVGGNGTIGGNLAVAGRITAEEFYTEITTASVIYASGSTKFGDDTGDKHEFTGSINVSGSVIYNGVILTNIDANTIQRLQQATASIQVATASLQFHSASVDAQLLAIQQTTQSLQIATASLQAFSSSVNDQLQRVYQTTQSLHVATASLQFHSASVDSQLLRLQQTTQSLQVATASLQQFTASQDSRNFVISQYTSSTDAHIVGISTFTSSQYDTMARVYQATSSLQSTTASLNQFTASQDSRNLTLSTVTGSLIGITNGLMAFTAALDNTYATDAQLYQLYQATRSIELTTGSLIGITNGLMAFTAALDNTYATDAQLYQLYQATRSLELHSGSMVGVTNGLMAYTASLKGQAIVSSSTQIQNYDVFALNSNLYNGTGSIKAEVAGIESYTASLKSAAIVSSSTQIFTGYDYEIHVSQVDGNDTTGNGDLLTPVATITKALQIVTANFGVTDRRTIILHPGTYTENPTISIANTYIFALGLLGANTAIAGTLTINAACRVSGIKMTNLVVNTTAAVYINNTTVDTQMTVTNTGYLETTGCSFQCPSGVTVSGAAPAVVFNSTTLWGLVVNNASAVVIVRNSPQVYVATVTAGNLALSNTLLFSSTPTGNAITTSASSVVTLSNLNILDNTGLAVARVSLSGFYSIIDVVYDKPNSTLVSLSGTGGPLNAIDYFQYINADKFITQGGTGYQFLKGDGSLDSIMPASLQQTTASLNTYTGSNDSVVARILQTTASLNTFTGSLRSEVNLIEAYTASLKGAAIVSSSTQIQNYNLFAHTASANTFYGNQIFSGSVYVSGSVYGNVTAQPVASNTSSIDISTANFFTITLGSGTGTSGVTTHISASNMRAGQSVNILITTGTNSSASFSTNIKQPSGSFYQPTSGSGKADILSLVSFDTTNLYLVAVNQMI